MNLMSIFIALMSRQDGLYTQVTCVKWRVLRSSCKQESEYFGSITSKTMFDVASSDIKSDIYDHLLLSQPQRMQVHLETP